MRYTLGIVLCILSLLISAHRVSASEPIDSLRSADKIRLNPYIPSLSIGAATFVSGLGVHYGAPHQFAIPQTEQHSDHGTQFLQYAPMALPWVMKAAGVPTRSGWGRMALSQGVAAAIMLGTTQGMKAGVSSMRPDGADLNSFPSGHSALAFMGATATANELAHTSAWYPLGAYTLATAIAVERVVDGHHYPADVMAGAGVGILSTELGYLIGDVIFGHRQLNISGRDLRPNANFPFLSVSTGLNLPLGHIAAAGITLERLPALTASMRGGWGIDDHWGLALEAGVLSTPLLVKNNFDRTYVKNLNSIDVVLSPYFTSALNNRISLSAEIGGGYRRNLPINADSDAITSGSGTVVGKVEAGCKVRFTHRFSVRFSLGYELAGYRFALRPSEAYDIPVSASAHGISSALLLNISSRYEF